MENNALLTDSGDRKQPTENEPSSLEPKYLCHRSFYWHLFYTEILWRTGSVFSFNVLIMAVLYSFAKMGELSSWDRRGFNTLTILLVSLMSLSLGSLFTFLGTMIRWPILSSQSHDPFDADLILGMASPTGSLRLLYHHVAKGRPKRTTFIAFIYLLISIAIRLSVAGFGLTFELQETAGVEFPVMTADWRSSQWLPLNSSGLEQYINDPDSTPDGYADLNRFYDYARLGLLSTRFDFDPFADAEYNQQNISQMGIDRLVENNTVAYSYYLREYQGLEERSSTDRLIRSSSQCTAWALRGVGVYDVHRDQVGNISSVDADSPDFVRALDSILSYPITIVEEALHSVKWMVRDNWETFSDPSACVTSYIYTEDDFDDEDIGAPDPLRNATFFECRSCLTDEHDTPGIKNGVFETLSVQNTSMIAALLLRVGMLDTLGSETTDDSDVFFYREYNSVSFDQDVIGDLTSQTTLIASESGTFTDMAWPLAELYAAHIAARLPILTVLGADQQLPKVTEEPGASPAPFVRTVLEVNWAGALTILALVLAVEIIATACVFFWCRHLFLPDPESYLGMARLLMSSLQGPETRSLDKGKEIAEQLGGRRIRYRVVQIDDEVRAADLLDDGSRIGFLDGNYK